MPLKLQAELGLLSQIREYAIETATSLGVTPGTFLDLRLAIDEAITNILTHGYGGPGEIELELSVANSDLIVRLRDKAPTFDPALAPSVDLTPPDQRENPGGFGVFLMQSAMDEIVHRKIENGNELTMIKRNVVDDAQRRAR